MELELWLMRHGEAAGADAAGSDAERPLTERGRRQVQQIACWLAERTPAPEVVWHSPLKRARQTAELIATEFAIRAEEQPVLAPGMDAAALLSALTMRNIERAVCVGHQPDVGQVLQELIGGGRIRIPPGVCAAVVFSGPIVVGAGALRWLTDPLLFDA